MSQASYFIGLMSGTSADAIDAALVDLSTSTPQLIATISHPLDTQTRSNILALCNPGADEIDRMGAMDIELARLFANAALALIEHAKINAADVIAIGSHGQTIRHRPPQAGTADKQRQAGFTLQIGDPNTIAQLTGITTVADFRRRDMAALGQGAPLVPAFHRAIFQSPNHHRAIVNIGGMANITWLPTKGQTTGYDTGPGNVLLDSWIGQHLAKRFDANGDWAASGAINSQLLAQLLKHPFFNQSAPKSTGRETFNSEWLEQNLAQLPSSLKPEDVQATLLALTAQTIAAEIKCLAADEFVEVVVCGGGAFNTKLLASIQAQLGNAAVSSSSTLGIDPQWIEAMAFAWLAQQTLAKRPSNLCAVTGAQQEVILGGVYFA